VTKHPSKALDRVRREIHFRSAIFATRMAMKRKARNVPPASMRRVVDSEYALTLGSPIPMKAEPVLQLEGEPHAELGSINEEYSQTIEIRHHRIGDHIGILRKRDKTKAVSVDNHAIWPISCSISFFLNSK